MDLEQTGGFGLVPVAFAQNPLDELALKLPARMVQPLCLHWVVFVLG